MAAGVFIFSVEETFSDTEEPYQTRFKLCFEPDPLKEGEKMKTSMVGVVSAAILMILASVGFGIAQAAGTHSEQPVLSFEDQEAAQVATSPADGMQLGNPIETGGLPTESYGDSSKVKIEGYMEREWKGDIDGH